MEPAFDYRTISKTVGFHRRHQRVPELRDVDAAALRASRGDPSGAVDLLDWSRHCFYVKTESDCIAMERVFRLVKELWPQT